jgi:hypothetical protein
MEVITYEIAEISEMDGFSWGFSASSWLGKNTEEKRSFVWQYLKREVFLTTFWREIREGAVGEFPKNEGKISNKFTLYALRFSKTPYSQN